MNHTQVNASAGSVVHLLARAQDGALTEFLGTATGVSPTLMATCLHCTNGNDEGLVAIVGPDNFLTGYQDQNVTQILAMPVTLDRADPLHDLCLLRVPEGSSIAHATQIGSADLTTPGSQVTTFGYPHADFGRRVLTQQTPLVGARVWGEQGGVKTKQLVLNVQTRPGQSGGPVFYNGHLIGLVLGAYAALGGGGISLGGVDPATLHTTTFAVSAEYVKALLP